MRIIKLLIFSFLFLGVVGGGIFLAGREILLSIGVAQMKSAFKEVSNMTRNSGSYALECRKKGIVNLDSSSIKAMQIRFISDSEYQIEVICRQFSLDPILVRKAELPRFVSKTPGSSGMIWGEALSGVSLEVFGKTKSVFVEEKNIYEGTLAEIEGAIGPLTSCEGQGFECCQTETSLGQGEQLTNVTNCSNNCFSSCIKRPVVLSFSTQPFLDKKTRIARLKKKEELTVAYVIDPAGSDLLDVSIDFGDGTIESLSEFNGRATHTYECGKDSCQFDLKIFATNDAGIITAQTPITNLKVIVQ
jgi:hypothetical protein